MELHQNDSKTMESIKEVRAICTCATQDAEALCATTVKEAKGTHAHTIQGAEALCSTAIRDAGSQADSLQWRHVKTIQHLEEQVFQERKVRVRLTSSLPVKLPYKPAL